MKGSSSQTLRCNLFHSHSFSESWFCFQGLFFLCFMGRIIWAAGSGLFPCLIIPDDVQVALFVVTFRSALVCNIDFWSMLYSGKIKTTYLCNAAVTTLKSGDHKLSNTIMCTWSKHRNCIFVLPQADVRLAPTSQSYVLWKVVMRGKHPAKKCHS